MYITGFLILILIIIIIIIQSNCIRMDCSRKLHTSPTVQYKRVLVDLPAKTASKWRRIRQH